MSRALSTLIAIMLGAVVLGVALSAPPAWAEPGRERLELSVVEVAGGRAYFAPGPGRGVRIDDHVNVGRQRYRIAASSSKHIVAIVGDRRLARGQRAFVWATPHEVQSFATRPAPRSPHAFQGKWREPERPAESQRPKFVPLGAREDGRRHRASFRLEHSRIQPLSGPALPISRTRLRAALHAELARALTLDADASVELWQADDLALRRGNASRPLLAVQQLELSYRGQHLGAAIGRLRHAATTLGMLDGGRASAQLGGHWAVAAFGGTLADPLDARPETEAARFGGELLYGGELGGAPSRASLTLQGSRFAGRLDERRLTAIVESYPEFGRLGARAEASLFDADNPWNADPAELTALAGDAALRLGGLRLGLALETRRPERSYWLASALPAGYFCVSQTPGGSTGREPCLGGDMRSMAALSASWGGPTWGIDAGATAVTTRLAAAEQATAFLHLSSRDVLGMLRFDAGSSLSSGSLLESAALELRVGAALMRDLLDASIYYRPNLLRYKANSEQLLEHGTGAGVWWAVFDGFDASAAFDLITGADVDVLFAQATLAWRPRF